MGRKKGSYASKSRAILQDCIKEIEPFFGRITIRQLFYRMVSLGHYPSTDQKYYARFVSLMISFRLNGDIPLAAIVDNYRRLETISAWDGPEDFIENAKAQYRTNWWLDQKSLLFIWLEKDALFDLVWDTAKEFGVPVNVSRGYVSLSNLREVCEMVKGYQDKSNKTVHTCLYVGDHDPSGLDMEQAIGKYKIEGVLIQPIRVAITHSQGLNYPALQVKKATRELNVTFSNTAINAGKLKLSLLENLLPLLRPRSWHIVT